jgi:hypothetical protein
VEARIVEVVTYRGRQPTFPLALVAALFASIASAIASIAYSETMLSTSLVASVLSPLNPLAYLGAPGAVQWVLAGTLVLYGLNILLRAGVARWVIQSYGSGITFGRAVAAFVIADVWGAFLTEVVFSTQSHASASTHSPVGWVPAVSALVLFPLGLTGLAVSALVLSSASGAGSAGEPRRTHYIHPPKAPRDYP